MFVASFRLAPEAIALSATFEAVPDLEAEAEQIAAHSRRWTMPCLWLVADDFDRVDDALADDPSVDAVVGTSEFVDEKYCQFDWSEAVNDRIDSYVDERAAILAARGSAEGWRVRIRFSTRDQFDAFREELRDRGHSFELLSLVRPDESHRPVSEVTPAQREALRTAMERGYFEVPSEVTTRELAQELGTSHQNVSQLLQRGMRTLVDEKLGVRSDDEP